VHNERNKAEQEHFSQKKYRRIEKHMQKIQALLKEKKFTRKSHVPLAPSHSITG